MRQGVGAPQGTPSKALLIQNGSPGMSKLKDVLARLDEPSLSKLIEDARR
jgi:hypothetical protein